MKKLTILFLFLFVTVGFAKARVFYNDDDTITVRTFVNKLKKTDETDKEFMDRLSQDKEGIDYKDVTPGELPSREFRGKWRHNGDKEIFIDNTVITDKEQKELDKLELETRIDKAKTLDELKEIIKEAIK